MKYFFLMCLVSMNLTFITKAHSLNKELSLIFWYDHTPPTSSDSNFFNGASDSIKVLNSNNKELETIGKNKGIEVYNNKYAKYVLDKILSENGINKGFFYDLEKAQLISVTRMFLNNCRVNNECTEKVAKQYSEKFVIFAGTQTSKNRNISLNKSVNISNDAILMALVGGFVVHTVSSIVNADYSNIEIYSSNGELSSSFFGNQ